MEEKRKLLVEFLFENSCCLNLTPVVFCGSFISKEDCLKCIDNGLQELLQHNVSNRREQLIAFAQWLAHEEEYGKDGSVGTVDTYLESN